METVNQASSTTKEWIRIRSKERVSFRAVLPPVIVVLDKLGRRCHYPYTYYLTGFWVKNVTCPCVLFIGWEDIHILEGDIDGHFEGYVPLLHPIPLDSEKNLWGSVLFDIGHGKLYSNIEVWCRPGERINKKKAGQIMTSWRSHRRKKKEG